MPVESTPKGCLVKAWIDLWGWSGPNGIDMFLDYLWASIDEETDVGQRYEIRAQLEGLRAALMEIAGVTS